MEGVSRDVLGALIVYKLRFIRGTSSSLWVGLWYSRNMGIRALCRRGDHIQCGREVVGAVALDQQDSRLARERATRCSGQVGGVALRATVYIIGWFLCDNMLIKME